MTGSGTLLDPYVIWDVVDLQNMANGAPYAPNAWYELGGNIDASATPGWNWNAGRGVFEGFVPRAFSGNFNGRYFRISDLYMDRFSLASIAVGLFGSAAAATIQNLMLLDLDITSYAQGDTVANNTGGLVGYCGNNTIRRVITTGTILATNNDTNWAGPHGNCNAGGMLGLIALGCTVDQCASYVNVTALQVNDALAYGGGFVGSNIAGAISNSYARGSVSAMFRAGGFVGVHIGAAIDNSYSTGAVVGIGGGFNGAGGGPITDSFWDMDTSGWLTSFGGTGRNTPAMKTQANYTAAGWDFATIWDIDLTGVWNNGYPFFRWDPIPTVTVTQPNGGENWEVGSTHQILWIYTQNPGTDVVIELLKSGVFNRTIIGSTPVGVTGSGSYSWTIAANQAPGTDHRVRITSTTGPYTDTSNNDFTISAPVILPQVVTLPATEIR